MDECELIFEVTDRHDEHLVYRGAYRLLGAGTEALQTLFADWQQRIYRFENNLGASVIFYPSAGRANMTWDLVTARFVGGDPFDFRYADSVSSKLRWREVQQQLDSIKAGRWR